jgi:hypothetical protein
MSNDPAGRIVAYQKAWQAFQRALQAAEQCVQRAREQAARLEQWKQLPPPGRAPAGTVGLRFDPGQWPAGEAISTALSEYHASVLRLKQQWEALQPAERIGFQAPPG